MISSAYDCSRSEAGERNVFDLVRAEQVVQRGGVEGVEGLVALDDNVALLGSELGDDLWPSHMRSASKRLRNSIAAEIEVSQHNAATDQ